MWKEQGKKKGDGVNGWGQNPSVMGENFGGREASGVDPETHGVGREEEGCKASRVEKTPGGGATEWVGESSHFRTTQSAMERAGWLSFSRTTQPPTEGEGESSRFRTT